MPGRRIGLAWLTILLLLPTATATATAPAQAQPTVRPTQSGGVEVLDAPDVGAITTGDLVDRPTQEEVPTVIPPPSEGPSWQQPEQDIELLPPVSSTYVDGTVARIRTDGRAAIPRGAPKRVRRLISQYNRIAGKRYKWGGGHAILEDRGYDCSGAVGYGLIRTGVLGRTMVSGTFARWGSAGAGRWVTIYANSSHVYMEIAGLRLDTSSVGDRGGAKGVRWRPAIGKRDGFKVRHPAGL